MLLRHISYSFIFSTVIVSVLVGNAYMLTSIGYSGILKIIGTAILFISFFIAIPPGMVYLFFQSVGILPELVGRESFIESNPFLWIVCVLFYTVIIYLVLRYRYQKTKK